jgi:hypothetical protein
MAGKAVKSFSCPVCGGIVEIHAVGHSITAVCSHCSSVIDAANDNYKIILKDHEASRETDIPIGAKGVLDNIKWEVIGYVEKRDKSSMSYWDEYLLFNPYFGFRFLVQSSGHWNLASIIKRYVPNAGSASEIELDREKYSVYCRGQSSVDYVKGEFYWRIRKGDEDRYVDYISPPRMLSVEINRQEITESLAEYIKPEEVEKAFGIELPSTSGIAPNQPPPFFNSLGNILKIALLSIFITWLIQMNMSNGTVVGNSRIHVMMNNKDKTFSSEVFTLSKRSNLFVKSYAPLVNSWMELELSLVSEASNQSYDAKQVLEYYQGIDDGDAWSEGGQIAESSFSAIPAGSYRLVIEPSTGLMDFNGMDVTLEIRKNVAVWGNFWMIFLLLIAFPVYAFLYRWYFENKRWENSDYAPAIYRSGESDD